MTKEEMIMKAEELINHLPENASWDDLMYNIYVRQKIEKAFLMQIMGVQSVLIN